MAHIAHLTSAHPRDDTRIFVKQCTSMAESGHKVTLVVADDLGDSVQANVRIVDVGKRRGRLDRMVHATQDILECAKSIDADIYIIHDPELIPVGINLKRRNRKIVFDAHEDVPAQIRGKPYLNRFSASILAVAFGSYERFIYRKFDGIVAATPFIRKKLIEINSRTIDINNYPIVDEFKAVSSPYDKAMQVCYVGNISKIRGAHELVQACQIFRTPTKLALAGSFESTSLALDVAKCHGWHRVRAMGHLNRQAVANLMSQSIAGLVTLHPQPNYLNALPVKMFEYMAAGLPVIASNFPAWQKIIDDNECGICVDPLDPASIAAAVDYVVMHSKHAAQMGENGRLAVIKKYNWQFESQKMLAFYDSLMQ